jgi:hypothetical protein
VPAVQARERTWIGRLICRSRPEFVETETDYLITIGGSEPAFFVLMNPNAVAIADPSEIAALVQRAQRERRAVFQMGRAIILSFNNAWASPQLVCDLVELMKRHQLGGPVPTLRPRSRLRHSLRVARGILGSLLGTPPEPAAAPAPSGPSLPLAASAPSRAEAAPAAAPAAPAPPQEEPVGTTAWPVEGEAERE